MSSVYLLFFTQIASTAGFLIVVGGVMMYFIVKKQIYYALVFGISSVGLMIAVEVLKNIFRISRPEYALIEASGYALPSAHAAGSIFLAVMIAFFARKQKWYRRYVIYIACALAAIAIGTSRLYLGVHTPFQVSIGYALGVSFAVLCIYLMNRKKL